MQPIATVTGLQTAIDAKADIAGAIALLAPMAGPLFTGDRDGRRHRRRPTTIRPSRQPRSSKAQGYSTLANPAFTGTVTGVNYTFSGKARLTSTAELTTITDDLSPLQIGATAGKNMTLDRRGIQARDNGVISEIYLNPLGGSVHLCGGDGEVFVGAPDKWTYGLTCMSLLANDLFRFYSYSVEIDPRSGHPADPRAGADRQRRQPRRHQVRGRRHRRGEHRVRPHPGVHQRHDGAVPRRGRCGSTPAPRPQVAGDGKMRELLTLSQDEVYLPRGNLRFPAVQVLSSNANTIDDAEKGTWVPVINGTTTAGSGTYQTQIGRYTKVGRLVFYEAFLSGAAHTGTGNMVIGGGPFVALASVTAPLHIVASNLTFVGQLYAEINTNSSTVAIGVMATNAAKAALGNRQRGEHHGHRLLHYELRRTQMALKEKSGIDLIAYLPETGHIEVRRADVVLKDGLELSRQYHRHVVEPGIVDLSAEDEKVRAIGEALAGHRAEMARLRKRRRRRSGRGAKRSEWPTLTPTATATAAGGSPSA